MSNFKVGDKIKIKFDGDGCPDKSGNKTMDSVILIKTKSNPTECLILTDPAYDCILDTDDVEYYTRNVNSYECMPGLKSYLGKHRVWIYEEALNDCVIAHIHQYGVSKGMHCNEKHCNTFNEYAEPNMPDGTYKCYSCRHL